MTGGRPARHARPQPRVRGDWIACRRSVPRTPAPPLSAARMYRPLVPAIVTLAAPVCDFSFSVLMRCDFLKRQPAARLWPASCCCSLPHVHNACTPTPGCNAMPARRWRSASRRLANQRRCALAAEPACSRGLPRSAQLHPGAQPCSRLRPPCCVPGCALIGCAQHMGRGGPAGGGGACGRPRVFDALQRREGGEARARRWRPWPAPAAAPRHFVWPASCRPLTRAPPDKRPAPATVAQRATKAGPASPRAHARPAAAMASKRIMKGALVQRSGPGGRRSGGGAKNDLGAQRPQPWGPQRRRRRTCTSHVAFHDP